MQQDIWFEKKLKRRASFSAIRMVGPYDISRSTVDERVQNRFLYCLSQ